jgi:K+-transporting ATPase ATPase B chain
MNRVTNTTKATWEDSVPYDPSPRRRKSKALLERETVLTALKQAFTMLRPDIQWKNPVMFVVEVGTFLTLLYTIRAGFGGTTSQLSMGYFIALDVWLFLTVLFANFATALAEARGKAQAQSLRSTRHDGFNTKGSCGCSSRASDPRRRGSHRRGGLHR